MSAILQAAAQAADVNSGQHARPRWIEVLSHIDPRYGGLSSAVPALTSALQQTASINAAIAAFCAPGEETPPRQMQPEEITFWPASRMPWLTDGDLRSRWKAALWQADGVHIHGLWEQSTFAAAHAARSADVPYVLSAHGMLEPWALRNKAWKKRIYAALSERAIVRECACLHALTEAEVRNYRDFGARGPVAVIPNGVAIPAERSAEGFLEGFPHLRDRQIVLFLGRLHRKKGVDLLVEAWAEMARAWPEAHLVLAGPDDEGTAADLQRAVERLGLQRTVTFTGMLRDTAKWSALAAATCFILPSHSEGFSMGVLEAMGSGLPVIVTRQCNMPQVSASGAGVQIEPEVPQIAAAIHGMLAAGGDARERMGQNGRDLVQQNYSWTHVAQRMAAVYAWVRGESSGIPPEVRVR